MKLKIKKEDLADGKLEEAVKRLQIEMRLAGMKPEDRLKGLNPEQRLSGLKIEELKIMKAILDNLNLN